MWKRPRDTIEVGEQFRLAVAEHRQVVIGRWQLGDGRGSHWSRSNLLEHEPISKTFEIKMGEHIMVHKNMILEIRI